MRIKTLIILITLLFTGPVNSFSSLMWQKLKLEKDLRDKVTKELSSIAPGVKNVVAIDVLLKPIEEPDFETSEPPPPGGSGDDADKKKKKKKEEKKDKPKKKSVVNFTDDPGEKKRVDEVIFAKFGLSAPLVDDFVVKKEVPPPPPPPEPKTASGPGAPPVINAEHEKWKAESSRDIEKYIDKIDVAITIDDGIEKDLKEIIKNNFTKRKWYVGEHKVTTSINFEKLTLKPPVKDTLTKALEYIKKFEVLLGFLAFGFLALISLLLFAKKLEKVFAKKSGGAAAAASGGSGSSGKDDKEENEKNKETSKETQISEDSSFSLNGVEKFIHFINMFPHEGKLMLSAWVEGDDDLAKLKVNTLTYMLETEKLTETLAGLTDDQRLRWKEKLSDQISDADRQKALGLISQEVLEAMVAPESKMPPETFDIMMALEPKNAANFLKEHTDLAPVLYTELKPKILSEILAFCESHIVAEVLEKSLSFIPAENTEKYDSFSKVIKEYHTEKVRLPGAAKARDLLKNVSSDNEKVIFTALAKHTDEDTMIGYLFESYPSFLFKDLPEEFLKNALTSFNSNRRVNVIYILGEEGHVYRDIYAPDGSLAREMFDLEIEKIEFDKKLQKQLEENKESEMQYFTDYMREQVKNNDEFRDEIKESIVAWIKQNAPGGGANLKIAS